MTLDAGLKERLKFLVRVVEKEKFHLSFSANKLFSKEFTEEVAANLDQTPELAETLEAFVGRFCRLQDTVGDKLLLAWLKAVQEKPSTFIDNLDRAEKLNILPSADRWIQLRLNRNKMIHEYIEDAVELADSINLAKDGIGILEEFADNLIADINKRFFLEN